MEEKIYFLPDDNHEYSQEEISALIFDGKLVKRSLIWEKSLPDWIYLGDHGDFKEVFDLYDKEAEEKIKKALGEDEETLQKREMKKMFEDVSEEKIKTSVEWSYVVKWAALGILILLIPAIYFLVTNLAQKGAFFEHDDEQNIETINISDLKYRSGIIRIDEIKGIEIQKVGKKEEDRILEEVILQMRKEDAVKEEKTAKKGETPTRKTASASLFDKVSDEELKAFRSSFMKKAGAGSTAKPTATESTFAKTGQVELTQKQISEAIKSNYSTIRHCYERALKTDVGVRGRMEVTLHILGNGKVAKVVNNTPRFKGTEMERCVNEMITSRWTFPSFEGTLTTVTIPFVLSAQ